ncbi:MAG TPA: DUF488 domain-containing protein [Candidatus Sumerlaeota bacterium]|nr:DUF488 domain-containing protein [Candidatus Sumerlaeota bacterium]
MVGTTVYTVGHSTQSLEEFVRLLRAHGVRRVVDIRTVPRSRHNPQFNRETLRRALNNRRLHYRHLKGLGGLRHARAGSPNAGWRNASFRGFADYMQTEEFEAALGQLMELAEEEPTAIMCAEAVPWRCHRSLVADALIVRGAAVRHLHSPTKAAPHTLTPFARVRGGRITYPAEAEG